MLIWCKSPLNLQKPAFMVLSTGFWFVIWSLECFALQKKSSLVQLFSHDKWMATIWSISHCFIYRNNTAKCLSFSYFKILNWCLDIIRTVYISPLTCMPFYIPYQLVSTNYEDFLWLLMNSTLLNSLHEALCIFTVYFLSMRKSVGPCESIVLNSFKCIAILLKAYFGWLMWTEGQEDKVVLLPWHINMCLKGSALCFPH